MMPAPPSKKSRGQFYTTHADRMLQGLNDPPPASVKRVIEPCAGQGDLVRWIRTWYGAPFLIEAWDIDPRDEEIGRRDTLLDPPEYADAWVVTNPPYLARNKSEDKTCFDLYQTNDLYKCFLVSLVLNPPHGGVLIIPSSFFLSPRGLDTRVRNAFMRRFRITRINYFEETVFDDTPTTVVAFRFERSEVLREQTIPWFIYPTHEHDPLVFTVRASERWIVGGEVYHLHSTDPTVKVGRVVDGTLLPAGALMTDLIVSALDSGIEGKGRLGLSVDPDISLVSLPTSRTFARLWCTRALSLVEQQTLAERFNTFIEQKRSTTHSLFLPAFRESKEYARKRIPFELVYRLVEWLIEG